MGTERQPIVLPPGGGRRYDMPRICATFKADGAETADAYSISTWRLEPHCTGPGGHSHPEDDVFIVTEGVMSLRVGGEWIDAPVGTFVLVPGGVTHDFENRSDGPATVLNVSAPGAFESRMAGITEWFEQHPPSYA